MMRLDKVLSLLDDAALDNFMRSTQAQITDCVRHEIDASALRSDLEAAIRERNVRLCASRPLTLADIARVVKAA